MRFSCIILGAPVLAHSHGHYVAGHGDSSTAQPVLSRSKARPTCVSPTVLESSPDAPFFDPWLHQDAQPRSPEFAPSISEVKETEDGLPGGHAPGSGAGEVGGEAFQYEVNHDGPEPKDATYFRRLGGLSTPLSNIILTFKLVPV